jgi:hypothetical protein
MTAQEPETLTLGCTYWPRRKGPWFWDERFDRGEVRGELEHLADLGCRVARVLLPWATFQPQPKLISSAAFDRFAQALDAAETAGIGLLPTLMVGQLGGTRFLPRWLLYVAAGQGTALPERDPRPRTLSEGWLYPGALQNFYEQPDLLTAQRFLIAELLGNFGAHPAVVGWDLGGGDLISAIPPRAPDAALSWLDHLGDLAREADPNHPLWYNGSTALLQWSSAPRLGELGSLVDRLALSVVPFNHSAARGPADTSFVLYTLQLGGTLAETGGRPVGCLGTGVPTAAPVPASRRGNPG